MEPRKRALAVKETKFFLFVYLLFVIDLILLELNTSTIYSIKEIIGNNTRTHFNKQEIKDNRLKIYNKSNQKK